MIHGLQFMVRACSLSPTPGVAFMFLRFRAYGAGFVIHGLWFMVYDVWFLVSGLRFLAYDFWIESDGLGFMVYGVHAGPPTCGW